ncbi:probable peptidyl-tRNA hydrolase 2 [Contarinia nasturtii]|uniref:probable peptidyl-tRNA hydrolase 2 n=1 Tax=Contarinia nasturtii TaxID=265458 RepID=UPI0012D3D207|nr:probable peptidyl-tRNA hydrolase 2 [Contarinia nasturtii]
MAKFFKSIFQRTSTALKLSEPMQMSLVVRNDLKMSPGKIAAQCAHAAVMCYEKAAKAKPEHLNAWIHLGQPKIILRVSTQGEIEYLAKIANEKQIVNGLVRDAGRTEVLAGTVTVVGIGPDTKAKVDEVTKKLKLL